MQREIGRRHVRSIRHLVGGRARLPRSCATLRTLTDKLRAAQADIPDPG